MSNEAIIQAPASIAWWREARFGMFIHWGIYAQPAGVWNGKDIHGIGEWIMYNGKIPVSEYEKLATTFNPVKFDADAWVSLAKRAGMKYLVLTAKHHDGFAMFHSPSNPYNIVDGTPFKRDVAKELADACARHGVTMCFYYSQAQDWHAPGGAGHWDEVGEKGWHSATMPAENFARYLETKVKPQLRELLTQYGPIGLIWFDTPVVITREQSMDLRRFVHSLQPDCLVSGRVGHDAGDYGSLGDNMIPCGPVKGDWESPATLNDTWGYKSKDHNWKSSDTLLGLLAELAGKGANYLLNIGPTGEGEIPPATVERLEAIGKWMNVNGEAIHGSSASPYPYDFPWGSVTQKDRRLYAIISAWSPAFTLRGLKSPVKKAWLLASPETICPFAETHTPDGFHELIITLPKQAPGGLLPVLVIETLNDISVDNLPLQQPDNRIMLPVHMAAFHSENGTRPPSLTRNGLLTGWTRSEDHLTWSMRLKDPGTFTVRIVLGSTEWERPVSSGHRVTISVDGSTLTGDITSDEPIRNVRTVHNFQSATTLGTITVRKAGVLEVSLHADPINPSAKEGLTLLSVELIPAPR
jgi:alpha-L-fucosidase